MVKSSTRIGGNDPSCHGGYPRCNARKQLCAGRSLERHDEIETSVSSPIASHVEQLERVLLRRSVGALEADRSRCSDCGRTPLVGEQVHVYDGRQQRTVCELCRPLRSEAPIASEIVRHFGHAVRLTARAA